MQEKDKTFEIKKSTQKDWHYLNDFKCWIPQERNTVPQPHLPPSAVLEQISLFPLLDKNQPEIAKDTCCYSDKKLKRFKTPYETKCSESHLHPASHSCTQKPVSSFFQSFANTNCFPLTTNCVFQESIKRLENESKMLSI